MSQFTLFLLAVGLSMDAFAVSISNGICFRQYRKRQVIYTAFLFGVFQGLMPILGFLLARNWSGAIAQWDHAIALILLTAIGGKMLIDAIKELRNPRGCDLNHQYFRFGLVTMQAIATSIDALTIGISLAVMQVNMFWACSLIASITFLCCMIGGFIGKKLGGLFQQKATIFGGIILIIIGVKIFMEHTFG